MSGKDERIERLMKFCRNFDRGDNESQSVRSFVTVAPKNSDRPLFALLHTLSLHNKGSNVYIQAHPDCRKYVEASILPLELNLHWDTVSLGEDVETQMEPNFLSTEYALSTHCIFGAIRWALDEVSEVVYLSPATIVTKEIRVHSFDAPIGVIERGLDNKATQNFGNLADEFVYIRSSSILNKWETIAVEKKISASYALDELIKDVSFELLDQSLSVSAERAESPYLSQGQHRAGDIIRGGSGVFRLYLHRISTTVLRMYDLRLKNGLAVITNTMMKANMYKELAILARAYRGKWVIQTNEQYNNSYNSHISRSIPHCEEFQLMHHDGIYSIVFETLRLINGRDSKDSIAYDNVPVIQRHCLYNPSSPSLLVNCADIPSLSNQVEEIGDTITTNVRGYSLGVCVVDSIDDEKMAGLKSICDLAFRQDKDTNAPSRLVKCKYSFFFDDADVSTIHLADLWAIGTVPIVFSTTGMELSPFTLVEGTHYIKCNSLSEVANRIASIDEKEWERMSLACRDLYIDNLHSTVFCEKFLKWYFGSSTLLRTRDD